MARLLRAAAVSVHGKDLVEVGAGWHPLLPVFLYGMCARSIVMTDLRSRMTGSLVESTIEYFLAHSSELADVAGCAEEDLHRRWAALLPRGRNWNDAWQDQGITYRAPLDFARSQLPSESADLVYSNSCLNYVPAPDLGGIITESLRILRPGGFIAHNIHVYDDLAGRDPSIRPWNFLRFSADEWQRLGNCTAHFQNRWRPQDYFDLATGSGMVVLHEERIPFATNSGAIDRSELHADFSSLPAEEIRCGHYLLVARKPEAAVAAPSASASRLLAR
jgi:SAM-dependent methyltransferase